MVITSFILSIVAVLISLGALAYSRRQTLAGEQVTSIEVSRRHDDLTPELDIKCQEHGDRQAELTIQLWVRLFGSAEHEIAILAYSALFLAEDAGVLRVLADKGRAGVVVRIALGDPQAPNVAERGEEEGIGNAVSAKIRNALMLYRPLGAVENIEIRLHRTVLYNSVYRADDRLIVNQHTYGIPAAQAPVFCLSNADSGEMAGLYIDSFERIWAGSGKLV